ncbi:EndoU domain-containing protein, partial [Enterococcus villorum]
STYYALADGLYDEERTDALPKTLNETTVQAIEEIGGNVLKNLPNYENTEMVIKQSESKFDPVDVLLVAMCLPWGEMRSLLKSVEAGETLAVIEVEEAQAKAVLATEEKAVLTGSPNKLLVEKLPTTKYFQTKNLNHLAGEVKTAKNGKPILTGAHSQHPDFYAKESGIVYESEGKVVEGMPYKATVRYKVEGKIVTTKGPLSTVFPDNWNAEKITSEVERIIEMKKPAHVEPGKLTLQGTETGGKFDIEVEMNVKANGKVTLVTTYPLLK